MFDASYSPSARIEGDSCSLSGYQPAVYWANVSDKLEYSTHWGEPGGTFCFFARGGRIWCGETLIEPRMEGTGAEVSPWRHMPVWLLNQVLWRRSSGPVRRMANSETRICSHTSSHHGEAGAAHPSSAEAFVRVADFKNTTISEGAKTRAL